MIIYIFLPIHRCTRKMGSLNWFTKTGGPWGFPVLLILCILTNTIQGTTARDEPTTTDTTATADRRSRDCSLYTNVISRVIMLYIRVMNFFFEHSK